MFGLFGNAPPTAAPPPESLYAPAPQVPYGLPWPSYPEQMIPELVQLPPQVGGHVVKNPLIDGVDVWYQTFDPAATVTIPANGQINAVWRVPPASNLRGDAELFYLLCQNTGRFMATGHLVGSYDRLMMNAPITVNMLAGTAQLPHELAESVFMESAGNVNWLLQDLSGEANNVTLVGFGRQFINYDIVGMNREAVVESFRQRASHPYWLTFDQVENATGGITLAANETRENATLEMTVPGDGDFVCYGVLDDSDGDYTVEMFSGRAGKRNQSQALPRAMFASLSTFGGVLDRRAASFPFRWRQARLFNRQTKVTFRITNLTNENNTIRIALFGRKVYYPELGKMPMELLGRYLVPRPLATSGSGNWAALNAPLRGQRVAAPVAPNFTAPGQYRG